MAACALVLSGLLTEEMAHICLDQIWLSNCSCHFLFLADLPTLEAQYGPRSYRYAMLETGRLGQLLYLAAESIGFGCCGIGAFYDSEAREFLNCVLVLSSLSGRAWPVDQGFCLASVEDCHKEFVYNL